jgi:hypothetical protein
VSAFFATGEKPDMLKLQEVQDFVAEGEAIIGDARIPVTIAGKHPAYLGPDPVECKVIPHTGDLPPEFDEAYKTGRKMELEATTEFNRQIWIPRFDIHQLGHSGNLVRWEGVAELFVAGDLGEFDTSEASIVCQVYVPRTELALSRVGYQYNLDGSIVLKGGERKSIRWNTRLGEAELAEIHEYYLDEAINLDRAKIQVQRCQVQIKPNLSGITSLKSVAVELEEALDASLWLLSFLGHKRIAWYAANIVFLHPDDYRIAEVRRKQWLGYERDMGSDLSHFQLLINRASLQNSDLFQRLWDNYQASPFESAIRRTIPYILSSYERSYTEMRIGMAYLALESLVDGLSENSGLTNLLGSSRFKRLSKAVKQLIYDHVVDRETADGIAEKIGELRRRSFVDKFWKLAEETGFAVERLWPPGTDVQLELHELIKRRNFYIHQGTIDDYDLCYLDLYRLQKLVELWILKLLGCPDEAINFAALNYPLPINKP